jgi:hypothetical protein
MKFRLSLLCLISPIFYLSLVKGKGIYSIYHDKSILVEIKEYGKIIDP